MPRQTWVFDSLPGAVHRDRAIGEHSVAAVIEALRRVPMPQPTKEGLVRHLTHHEKIPPFIAHWLMTSLQRHPGHGAPGAHHTAGGYVWAFDLEVVRALFRAYTEECFYDTLASPFLAADSHRVDFIRAGKVINPCDLSMYVWVLSALCVCAGARKAGRVCMCVRRLHLPRAPVLPTKQNAAWTPEVLGKLEKLRAKGRCVFLGGGDQTGVCA